MHISPKITITIYSPFLILMIVIVLVICHHAGIMSSCLLYSPSQLAVVYSGGIPRLFTQLYCWITPETISTVCATYHCDYTRRTRAVAATVPATKNLRPLVPIRMTQKGAGWKETPHVCVHYLSYYAAVCLHCNSLSLWALLISAGFLGLHGSCELQRLGRSTFIVSVLSICALYTAVKMSL